MNTFLKIVLIFIAGGLGTITRFSFLKIINYLNIPKEINTLMVNLIGSFLIGWAVVISNRFLNFPFQELVMIGFLGGLTTFSGMIFDFENLRRQSNLIAFGYLFINLLLGYGLIRWGLKC